MNTKNIPSRHFAGIFDIQIDESEARGAWPSTDAIGGYYGISWYVYFRDIETDEVYQVRCSDGEYGGKLAYSDEDEEYREKCGRAIIDWCYKLVESGATEIRMSRNEVAVMQSQDHSRWLETEPGKRDGEHSKSGLEGGLVGYCRGVSIICDLELEDDLPLRD